MRVLHTSDWHLGHTLRGEVTREHEHQAFLDWLVAACHREQPDTLLITGDVFDSATPPASAERMWFEVLAAARRACPAMDIIAIAGNHDSPARLGASSSVLRELNVHVIGGLPRTLAGAIDLDRILIPIAGGRGLVAAVPFLRPADLDASVPDPLEAVYAEVVSGLRARRLPGQATIVTGHLYVAGADVAYLSERRVSIGGVEAASLRMFPRDLDYVALGHIHRSQRIGRETIRYAGAPISLALDEASYRHQVLVIDFADTGDVMAHEGSTASVTWSDRSAPQVHIVPMSKASMPSTILPATTRLAEGSAPHATKIGQLSLVGVASELRDEASRGNAIPTVTSDVPTSASTRVEIAPGMRVREIRSLHIPQTIAIVRVPPRGAAPLADVLLALRGMQPRSRLPTGELVDDPTRPYLEIVVALTAPEPRLRALVEEALADKRPRLVYLHVEHTGDGNALAEGLGAMRRLAELDPREVFMRLWARDHTESPSDDVRAGFERLLAEVQGDLADPELS